jgi:MYXO-CTERM domain-containing protein
VRAYPRDATMDAAKMAEYAAQYPWALAHEMDAHVPGAPNTEAAVVSAYLQVIWDRVNGEASLENLVIATTPSDGAGGQPTDATLVESQVGIVFGHALDDASIGADTVTVTDASGAPVAIQVNMWRSESNVMRLRPVADWPADQVMTVTLHPGLRTIDGMTLDAPWSFEFSTSPAAADAPLPGYVDPTPNTSEPDVGMIVEPPPASEDGGGCSVGHARGSRGLALLGLAGLAGLVLVRRRRRATCRASA